MSYRLYRGLGNLGQISVPPVYLNNKWVCDQGSKPADTSSQQSYCCPSGWTISTYNDSDPCRSDQDLYDCGPIPKGASRTTAVCCNQAQQWFAKNADGSDPCAAFDLTASDILASGNISAADIAAGNQIFTPTMVLIGGSALAMMVILTIIVQDD